MYCWQVDTQFFSAPKSRRACREFLFRHPWIDVHDDTGNVYEDPYQNLGNVYHDPFNKILATSMKILTIILAMSMKIDSNQDNVQAGPSQGLKIWGDL